MIMHRWVADESVDSIQLKQILALEGFDVISENLVAGTNIPDHRHPFTEIRVVAEGTLIVTIAGNQVLMRKGDRIEIPSNTRHSYTVPPDLDCLSWISERLF